LAFALVVFLLTVPASRTDLQILQPEDGDATVAEGQPVHVTVLVEGKVPDPLRRNALKLLLRYQPGDSYEEQALDHQSGKEWGTTVPAFRVQKGFWYKVTGGNAETPEYRVNVRITPKVTAIDVTYQYRPYVCRPDFVIPNHDGNLKELRGTRVTLLVHTNRPVKEGRLDLELGETRESVPAELVANDPQALKYSLLLDQNGKYRIHFTTAERESHLDPATRTIQVDPDKPPEATLTKPSEENVSLPANGVLQVEGTSSDDIGVKNLTLRLRLADGPALEAKKYRPEKSFRFADGSYPKKLDYKDFVELDKVKDADGKPFPLQPGMKLEYWLEATDNCDYPDPNGNVGASKHQFVTITEPEQDQQKKDQQRNQAAAEQKKHEGAQDKKQKEENQAIQNQTDPQHSESKPDPEQQKKDQQTKDQAQKLQDEADKQKDQESKQGEGKGDNQKEPKGENKGEGQAQQKPGQGKGQGQGGSEQKPGQDKGEGGGQPEQKPDQSKGKGEGQGQVSKDNAQSKPEPGSNENTGQSKGNGQPEPKTEKAEGKGEGQGDAKPDRGQAKEEGAARNQEKSEAKGSGQQGGMEDKQPQGVAKSESTPPNKSEGKGAGNETAGAEQKGSPRDGGKNGPSNVAKGETKPPSSDPANGSGGVKADKKDEGQAGSQEKSSGKPLSDEAKKHLTELLEALKSDDPKKREEAAKKLDELFKKAEDQTAGQQTGSDKTAPDNLDEKTKKELSDLLKELMADRRDQENRKTGLGKAKDPPKDQSLDGAKDGSPIGDLKKPPDRQDESTSNKDGGKGETNAAKGEPKDGGKPQNPDGSGSGEQAGKAKERPRSTDPGSGNGNRDNPMNPISRDPPGGEANPEHLKRLGVLQLQKFNDLKELKNALAEAEKRKDDKAFQEQSGLTQQEIEDFLKRGRELEERWEQEIAKMPPPKRVGSLSNTSARPVTPGSDPTGDAKSGGRGDAPPSYQDAYKKFTGNTPGGQQSPDKK